MHRHRAGAPSVMMLAAAVWVVAACGSGCGGSPDLVVGGSLPATVTAVSETPTPTTCSGAGGVCDDVTVFCCSPFTCVAGGVCE